MPSVQSTHLQLVAALAAMSEANMALRRGAAATSAIFRAARCLDGLADCPDLAPALRRLCDTLSSKWAEATFPRPVEGMSRAGTGAAIITLRRPR